MEQRGWDGYDFLVVTADAYVDHPSFGTTIIARVLEAAGGASVVLEKDASGQALFQASCAILHDDDARSRMEKAMAGLGLPDATERIYQTILQICR